jgi:DNA polymerase-4
VAQNKLVSHAAAEVVKADGRTGGRADRADRADRLSLLDIAPGTEPVFLAPESVDLLPELDEKIQTRLDDYQLERIGEIQAIADDDLAAVFGPPGRLLGMHARGIDRSPVLPPAVKAEFRAVHTLGDDSNDLALLHRVLRHLTERLGARLRARRLTARRLTIHIAYTDYHTAKRAVPLRLAALDMELLAAARQAFALANQRTVALRAIGVVVDRFLEADYQLELWDVTVPGTAYRVPGTAQARSLRDPSVAALPRDDNEECSNPVRGTRYAVRGTNHNLPHKAEALQAAVDRIRTRWGVRGVRVGR